MVMENFEIQMMIMKWSDEDERCNSEESWGHLMDVDEDNDGRPPLHPNSSSTPADQDNEQFRYDRIKITITMIGLIGAKIDCQLDINLMHFPWNDTDSDGIGDNV